MGAIRNLTRLITLTYNQSLQIVEGNRPPEDFLGIGINYSGVAELVPNVKKEKRRAGLQDLLETKFPYLQEPQRRRDQDSGWVLTKMLKEIFWNIVTYRIGVREVGLHSFEFSSISSIVTVPATSPRPIWKVVLRADETIPASFRQTQAWIAYYVTFDDGKKWHRLNPIGKPTRFDQQGLVVPRVISTDSETTGDPEQVALALDEDVYQVRLKIVLRQDETAPNPTRLSPLVHRYKLLIYPRGGLSASEQGDL